MDDLGNKYTDKRLAALEKKFKQVYKQAEKETTDKLNDYLAKFAKQDAEKQQQLNDGEITRKQYREWRKRKIMTGKRWQELRDRLADDYTRANELAMLALNSELPAAFAENVNFAMYDIERLANLETSFTIYNRETVNRLLRDNPDLLPKPQIDIPKDKRWNRQKIQAVILQGVLQGESIPKISNRLRKVTDMNKAAATRNARTAMTGAQNGGREESYKRAQDMGINVMQQWIATRDSRTRDSHAVLDGEIRRVGERFSNGLLYPGDPHGAASEVYNCRCSIIPKLEGIDNNLSRLRGKLGDESYEDWKERHRQAMGK